MMQVEIKFLSAIRNSNHTSKQGATMMSEVKQVETCTDLPGQDIFTVPANNDKN